MTQSHFLTGSYRLVVIAALVLGLFVGKADLSAAETPDRPNIVLLMADDQGWGDVGYRGDSPVKTPVMDEMARVGLRLDRFYAAAPVCSPTRGSVLTGRHPVRYGCFSWGHVVRPTETTIAEALKSAGYRTGHFGKWHVGDVHQGSTTSPGAQGFDEWYSAPNFYENNPLLSHQGKIIRTEGEGSAVTAQFAIDFMRQAKKDDVPFLAVVWFGSPHSPHEALPEYQAMYPDQSKGQQNFLGEITAMDTAVGMIRDELRKLGIADNTLVWYTSDNGALPQGSTGGLSGRKGNLLEGGLRVPTMIEWPARIREPRTSEVVSGTVDIFPTLLEIAGVEAKTDRPLDGQSLLPLFDGTMTERERPLGFWVYPRGGIGTPSHQVLSKLLAQQEAGEPHVSPIKRPAAGTPLEQFPTDSLPGPSAWVDGDWKLHRKADKKGEKIQYELYNLADDPAEKRDVSDSHAERVEQMAAQLEEWQRSVVKSLNGEDD